MDLIATTLIQTGLKGLFTCCGKGMVRAFKSLSEYCGNAKYPLYGPAAVAVLCQIAWNKN